MARTRTLAQLRTQVRQAADIENAAAWTDSELDQHINDSIADLHLVLVECYEDDYTEAQSISTVAGTSSYALTGAGAVGVVKVRSVEVLAGTDYVPLVRWNFADRFLYESPGSGRPVAYRLIGKEAITLSPAPDAVYTVRVWLVPPPVALSLDADTYDGVSGYERYVVCDAAIKVGIKEESDVRALVGERERMLAKIKKTASTKDAGRPDVVLDTEPAVSITTNSLWWGR